MNLILFGAPGAGKGTQALELVKKYNIVHISTGAMFRQAIDEGTELGKIANSYISKGALVPDDITVGIVKERLAKEDCKNGFILDGFPRTLQQAECLGKIIDELNITLNYVIEIAVPTHSLLRRLTGRRMCKECGNSFHIDFNPSKVEGVCDLCGGSLYIRKDDNVESVKVRLDAYELQTKPLIEYYQKKNLLITVDGEKDINEVFMQIVDRIGD